MSKFYTYTNGDRQMDVYDEMMHRWLSLENALNISSHTFKWIDKRRAHAKGVPKQRHLLFSTDHVRFFADTTFASGETTIMIERSSDLPLQMYIDAISQLQKDALAFQDADGQHNCRFGSDKVHTPSGKIGASFFYAIVVDNVHIPTVEDVQCIAIKALEYHTELSKKHPGIECHPNWM